MFAYLNAHGGRFCSPRPRLGEGLGVRASERTLTRTCPLTFSLQIVLNLALQRAGRADAHAVAAEHAGGIRHIFLEEGRHVAVDAAPAPCQREGVLHIERVLLGKNEIRPCKDRRRVVGAVVFALQICDVRRNRQARSAPDCAWR